MTSDARGTWAECRRTITGVVEELFCVVSAVRDDALRRHRAAARRRQPLVAADVAAIRDHLQERLQHPGSPVTGLGLIMAPDVLADRHLYLEWWQTDPRRAEPRALQVDLNTASTGFYDYATAEWFAAPRRTGRRHIEGPYVDVHGTGAYIFTFSMPVEADGVFLGVAAADVPVSRLEDELLNHLPREHDAVVLNASGRVVLSSSPHWLVGELVPQGRLHDVVGQDLPNLPWRAVLLPQA